MPSQNKNKSRKLRNKRLKREITNWLGSWTGAAAILGCAVFFWLHDQVNSWQVTQEKVVIIKRGEGIIDVARKLREKGAISNEYSFILLYKIKSLIERRTLIQAGEYELKAKDGIAGLLTKLSRGQVRQHQIVIPEGFNSHQVLSLLQNRRAIEFDLQDCGIPTLGDGLLLPDTYNFTLGEPASELVVRMKVALIDFVEKEWEQRDKRIDAFLKNQQDAIILASIVEKEALFKDEQPIIAGVYLNRIKRKMRLQADPTVIYGMTNGKSTLGRRMLYADYKHVSAYNTYLHQGLPPTAICNPGRSAIKAVLHPEWSKMIYFVLNDNRRHLFTSNYAGHLDNLRNIRQKRSLLQLDKPTTQAPGKDNPS